MVFPIQRQRNFHHPTYQNPANNFLPNSNLNKLPNNRNNIQQMMHRFSQPQSTLPSLVTKSAGGLSKTLNNVQQVLKVVETAAPIVQQYGPIVKNLPAMYKMMKALNEIDNDDKTKEIDDINENNRAEFEGDKEPQGNGESAPKLYI